MHKQWRFRETCATCPECPPIRFVSSHVYSALCPYSTKAKNMVKSTVSLLFASLCSKDFEPRGAAAWSNCEQSQTLSTNNEFPWPMSRVWTALPRALYCWIKSVMQYSTSVWIHIRKANTRQIARFQCYVKLCVHWTWNQEGLLSDRTVHKFMHYAQEIKFSWHKGLTRPEGVQRSLVYCSVHETCAEWFLLH